MRDVIESLDAWNAAGKRSAVATVVAIKRSAPRPLGAKMAVCEDGAITGMVSGGCVEGAVITAALTLFCLIVDPGNSRRRRAPKL